MSFRSFSVAQDDPEAAFKAWTGLFKENKRCQRKVLEPATRLVEFYYGTRALKDLD
jgi:hypothetical protein